MNNEVFSTGTHQTSIEEAADIAYNELKKRINVRDYTLKLHSYDWSNTRVIVVLKATPINNNPRDIQVKEMT